MSLLDNLSRQGEGSVGKSLLLNLFPDTFLTMVIDRIETSRQGFLALQGHIEGVDPSPVLLTIQNGLLSGSISLVTAQYQVRPLHNLFHAVREIRPRAFPPEKQPLTPSLSAASGTVPFAQAVSGSPVIDVLVLYTPAAAAAAGGAERIQNEIRLAENQMNAALGYSRVSPRVSVVATAEVAYTESGSFDNDLSQLQQARGAFAGVPALRDQWGADLVSLIVSQGDACGVGYLMNSVNPAFAPWAYSVVRLDCAVGNLSFAHELGHNLGCHHDRANAFGSGAFPYSYGYQNPGVFRTILAYDNGCNCPRLPYYSNPDVFINGLPTGVPAGQPNAANNALTIENTAATVAAFRPSVNSLGFGDFDVNSALGFDAGYDGFRAMADVNGDGKADYCRFVGNDPNTYLSCALATSQGFGNYDFNSPPGFDRGYGTFRGMADANGDGKADYCRFVGNSPKIFLSCGLANDNGFGDLDFNSAPGYDIGYGTFRGMADVNGDGKADYCRFVGNAPNLFLSCGLAR